MRKTKDVFVIMPFSSTQTCTETEWSEIYDNVFKPAVEECGYSCARALPTTGSLAGTIIEKLRHATVVLADMTDRNPNVFYELGVRHSLSKRTITIAQGIEHVPSDLRGYTCITYGIRPAEVTMFKRDMRRLISAIENDPDKSDNPVSDYLDKENLNVLGYLQTENIKKLGALCTELSGNLITLTAMTVNPGMDPLLSLDCLRLLLHTLYVDVGPELLKNAYELQHNLVRIQQGARDAVSVERTPEYLRAFSERIAAIRNKLIVGEYHEPQNISSVVWVLADELTRKLACGIAPGLQATCRGRDYPLVELGKKCHAVFHSDKQTKKKREGRIQQERRNPKSKRP